MAKKTKAALEGEEIAPTPTEEAIPQDANSPPEEAEAVAPKEKTVEEVSTEAVTPDEAVAEAVAEVYAGAVKVVSTIEGNIRTIDGSKIGKGETGLLTPEDAEARKEAGQVEIVA